MKTFGTRSLAMAALAATLAAAAPAALRAQENPRLPSVRRSVIQVGKLRITGLQADAGKFLHVFHVSARPSAMQVKGSRPSVHSVLRDPIRVEISPQGTVDVEAVSVPGRAFERFTFLVVAVSGAEPRNLFLRNPDQSVPRDPRIADPAFIRETEFVDPARTYAISSVKLAGLWRDKLKKAAEGPVEGVAPEETDRLTLDLSKNFD